MDFELTKEQIDLQQRARTFVDTEVMPHYKTWPITAAEYSPELTTHLKQKMADFRLTKLLVPKDFAGQGLGATEDIIVLAELSRQPRRMPGAVFSPWPVFFESSPYIQQKYLQPVLDGKTGWSMCFTEPEAGSDLAAIKTTAVKKSDKYVINGRKMWRTGHSFASYTAVACVTDPSAGYRGISMILVDNDTPGFTKVRDIPVIARQWGGEEEVKLDNVEVPVENLLGGEGNGFGVVAFDEEAIWIELIGLTSEDSRRRSEYLLKGAHPKARLKMNRKRISQGRVKGKRCGTSEDIGKQARLEWTSARETILNAIPF